ncbi:MAG TPA: hypothetical protein VEK74_09765 [Burkholderiaceae bacterium]|nr:hypothetical protein [Burkholderiaceae bacterium]
MSAPRRRYRDRLAAPQGAGTLAARSLRSVPGRAWVTTRENASGQAFSFTANPSTISSLKVGQGIDANMTTHVIWLDGKAVLAPMAVK